MKNIKNIICPKCGLLLNKKDNRLYCQNQHCYDIAKEGYVNLLLANEKNTKNPGDNEIMIKARNNFLEKGYFKKLIEFITFRIKAFENINTILDAGCGSGYYIDNLSKQFNVSTIGIDISKSATKIASKKDNNTLYLVSSIYKMPIKDNSIDVLLNIFAPKPNNEFKRVLLKGGYLIEVVPGENHLIELKNLIYFEETKKNEEKFSITGLGLKSSDRVSYKITISNKEDLDNLIKMTPYYYTSNKMAIENLQFDGKLQITLDFVVNVYQNIIN